MLKGALLVEVWQPKSFVVVDVTEQVRGVLSSIEDFGFAIRSVKLWDFDGVGVPPFKDF